MPTPVCSLHELNFSLRALSFLPGLSVASPMKGAAFAQAPLLRSLSLQRLPIEASTYRDLPQPLRSALAVSHDLDVLLRSDPFRSLPRIPLMGFFPPRLFPNHRGPRRLRHRLPSWPSSRSLPPSTGASCLALLPCRASRVLLLRLDRIRQLLVSHTPGTVTLLGFSSLGPRFPGSSRGEPRPSPGPYGPVTCPELRKSNNVLRKKLQIPK